MRLHSSTPTNPTKEPIATAEYAGMVGNTDKMPKYNPVLNNAHKTPPAILSIKSPFRVNTAIMNAKKPPVITSELLFMASIILFIIFVFLSPCLFRIKKTRRNDGLKF